MYSLLSDTFWEVTRKELEETRAEVREKDVSLCHDVS